MDYETLSDKHAWCIEKSEEGKTIPEVAVAAVAIGVRTKN